jgi:hypothetical protein
VLARITRVPGVPARPTTSQESAVGDVEPAALLGLAVGAVARGGAAEATIDATGVGETAGVDETADCGADVDSGAAAVQPTNTIATNPVIAENKRVAGDINEFLRAAPTSPYTAGVSMVPAM